MQWYQDEYGQQFAYKFYWGIIDTIETLSQMPTIGMLDETRSTPKTKLYTFLSHPKYRVAYRYTAKTLYIVAIRSTQMRNY